MDTLIMYAVAIWLVVGLIWTLSQWEKSWHQAKLMGFQKWFLITVLVEIILWPIGIIGMIYVKKINPPNRKWQIYD